MTEPSLQPNWQPNWQPCIDRLIDAARLAPSADNCQPWCFLRHPRGLAVTFDGSRSAGGFGPRDLASLLAAGALVENLLAAADEAGIVLRADLCSGAGDPPRYVDALIEHCPAGAADAPRDHPLWRRQTNRFPYLRSPLPPDLSAGIAALAEPGARVRVIEHPAQVRAIAGLVGRGTGIRFRIRELHGWLMASLRLTPEAVARGDGLDPATLALPPGGEALLRLMADWGRMRVLNALGLFQPLAAMEAATLGQAPAIVVITAADGPDGGLAAGRLLGRAWHRLAAAGVAAHPYFVLADLLARFQAQRIPADLMDEVAALRADTVAALGIGEGERLCMLLRVGYPTRTAPRSRRLPAAAVVVDGAGLPGA